jgi:hypothetical protein
LIALREADDRTRTDLNVRLKIRPQIRLRAAMNACPYMANNLPAISPDRMFVDGSFSVDVM